VTANKLAFSSGGACRSIASRQRRIIVSGGSGKSVNGTHGIRPTSPACRISSAGIVHNSTTCHFRRHADNPRRLRRFGFLSLSFRYRLLSVIATVFGTDSEYAETDPRTYRQLRSPCRAMENYTAGMPFPSDLGWRSKGVLGMVTGNGAGLMELTFEWDEDKARENLRKH